MARVAKTDMDLVNKGREFIKHLINDKHISHTSIGRAIQYSNTTKIKDGRIGKGNFIKIFEIYYNNYIKWCNEMDYEPLEEVVKFNDELYS